jgi:hypothetical protein
VGTLNLEYGIVLDGGSSRNVVTGCIARRNGVVDAADEARRGANRWSRNSFGRTQPPGLGR